MAIKYYDATRVITKQKRFNFIVGPRGYGKTYGYKRYCVSRAIAGKGKFIYMRRKQTEVDSIGDFFGDIASDPKFTKKGIIFRRKANELYYSDHKDEKDKDVWVHIGTIMALSTQENQKSRPMYPHYSTLLFDEWLPTTASGFIKNEMTHFNSALDTLFRQWDRGDEQIFCVGNSSVFFNPYFEYYNCHPNIAKEFTIGTRRPYLVQLISSDEWAEIRSQTPLGLMTAGTDYSNYADKNQFKDDDDALVEAKPGSAENILVLNYNGLHIGIWLDHETGVMYFSEQFNSTITAKFAFDYDNLNTDYQTYRNLFESRYMEQLQIARRQGLIRFTSKKAKAYSKPITSKLYLL